MFLIQSNKSFLNDLFDFLDHSNKNGMISYEIIHLPQERKEENLDDNKNDLLKRFDRAREIVERKKEAGILQRELVEELKRRGKSIQEKGDNFSDSNAISFSKVYLKDQNGYRFFIDGKEVSYQEYVELENKFNERFNEFQEEVEDFFNEDVEKKILSFFGK